MSTLRTTHTEIGRGRHRAAVTLWDGVRNWVAESEFDFTLGQQDRERLRWYMEDSIRYSAPSIPRRPSPAQSSEA